MSWVIEFREVGTDELIGRVFQDGSTDNSSMASMVVGMEPDEILERFDGWSNGYVKARRTQ